MRNGGLKITPRARRVAAERGLATGALPLTGTGFDGGVCERDVPERLAEGTATTAPSAANAATAAAQCAARVTPLARRLAAAKGIDPAQLEGTGLKGKILKQDVLDYALRGAAGAAGAAPNAAAAAAQRPDGKTVLEVKAYAGVRKIIGERLAASKFTAPHLYFTQKVDMGELLALRRQVNASLEDKATVTDFIVRAAARALVKYPDINASLCGDRIELYESVHIGVAVAAPAGLIVPVLRDCERKSLSQIASESAGLVRKARDGKLRPDEYGGGTFTVSNLGMFGIENFTAIINPPESAILAVSAVKDAVVAADDGAGGKAALIRPMMNITLTVDHRIIDGLLAARFVTEVKRILEEPVETLL